MTGPTHSPGTARASDLALVRDVAAGAVTEEEQPWVFEEDVLLFAVRRLEEDDPHWLLQVLGDVETPFRNRVAIFAETRDLREQALRLLRRERPGFVPELVGMEDGPAG